MSYNDPKVSNLDYRLEHAIRQIKRDYGDEVFLKDKSLAKFGSNALIGTSYATVMKLPASTLHETYVSTNAITHISSSDASDTQNVSIEGHTISGSNLTFSVQSATLNGQNKVALTTPIARSNRLENLGSVDFEGDIYVYEDDTLSSGVPTTPEKVHLVVEAGIDNQSAKAATAISSVDYWLITGLDGSINEKTSSSVDIKLQVRSVGSVFRTIYRFAAASDGANTVPTNLDPVIIVRPNSDVRMIAKATNAAVDVSARIKGYLALKRN